MTIVGKGADDHFARLERMINVAQPVQKALNESAVFLKQDAVDSINEGAILGPGHLPSAPGSPPNSDSLALVTSADSGPIRQGDEGSEPGAVASYVSFGGSLAPYAVDQEVGNSILPERPYLRPATARARPKVRDSVISALNKTNRGK